MYIGQSGWYSVYVHYKFRIYFVDVFRQQYMQFLVYMQTPEYKESVKEQIEKEKVKNCTKHLCNVIL